MSVTIVRAVPTFVSAFSFANPNFTCAIFLFVSFNALSVHSKRNLCAKIIINHTKIFLSTFFTSSFNIKPTCSIIKPTYSIIKPTCSITKPTCSITKPTCSVIKLKTNGFSTVVALEFLLSFFTCMAGKPDTHKLKTNFVFSLLIY